MGVTALPDNNPEDKFGYEVTVWSGYRAGSGTTSQVVIVLNGDEADSEPRTLRDLNRPILQRASVDSFLLTSSFPLGNISAIRYEP